MAIEGASVTDGREQVESKSEFNFLTLWKDIILSGGQKKKES